MGSIDDTREEHARIEGLLLTLARGDATDESAFFELMEELTPHLATHHAILSSTVRNVLGEGALQTEVERLDARMRALVLRMGALWKLGSTRFGVPLTELLDVFREHAELEEQRVVPALARAMDAHDFAALERTMAAKHRAVASAFRTRAARARSSAA